MAEEIFEAVEKTIAGYTEEILRSKDLEISRLRMQLKLLKSSKSELNSTGEQNVLLLVKYCSCDALSFVQSLCRTSVLKASSTPTTAIILILLLLLLLLNSCTINHSLQWLPLSPIIVGRRGTAVWIKSFQKSHRSRMRRRSRRSRPTVTTG